MRRTVPNKWHALSMSNLYRRLLGIAGALVLATTLQAAVNVTVTPATASVQVTGTFQFTVKVTGSGNSAVTWTVNGVTGGNATVGTISTKGLYTAPATVPSPSN